MTRTDVMASSRPQAVGAAPNRRGPAGILRRFSLVPVVLLVAMALIGPGTALAAEKSSESGYGQEANKPKESTGTSPSKESSSPASKSAEPSTSTAPTAESAKSSTLPFTGLNLTWVVGGGLLLMAAGFSIVVVQRRERREH